MPRRYERGGHRWRGPSRGRCHSPLLHSGAGWLTHTPQKPTSVAAEIFTRLRIGVVTMLPVSVRISVEASRCPFIGGGTPGVTCGVPHVGLTENRTDMKLLDEVLGAYGGVERWRELDTIKIHQIVGGVLWTLKNVDGVINDSTVDIRVQEQRAWHRPFTRAGLRSSYSPAASPSRPTMIRRRPSMPRLTARFVYWPRADNAMDDVATGLSSPVTPCGRISPNPIH